MGSVPEQAFPIPPQESMAMEEPTLQDTVIILMVVPAALEAPTLETPDPDLAPPWDWRHPLWGDLQDPICPITLCR